jgi:hypothetical protein
MRILRPLRSLALCCLAAAGCAPNATLTRAGGRTPASGTEVLERMRAAYADRWYPSLTFVQSTRLHRPDGRVVEQTWYESVRHTPERGAQLRIDVGDLAAGNGMLATADSTWVVRGGAVANVRAKGNEFLPLIEGVYLQPVERTARELLPTRVDLAKVRAGTWRDRDVWVVGAASAADSVAPQFWVDAERLVVVRMLLQESPAAPVMDVHIDGYVPAGRGWLGTDVKIHVGGRLVQEERYTDWAPGARLDDALFDPSRWLAAPHWARKGAR